jgi:hypothetical protein
VPHYRLFFADFHPFFAQSKPKKGTAGKLRQKPFAAKRKKEGTRCLRVPSKDLSAAAEKSE